MKKFEIKIPAGIYTVRVASKWCSFGKQKPPKWASNPKWHCLTTTPVIIGQYDTIMPEGGHEVYSNNWTCYYMCRKKSALSRFIHWLKSKFKVNE